MNKVITIHLNGRAYQLEEPGFEALQIYLADASARLASDPGKDEIVADLENAIAEKCERRLSTHKSVITTAEINDIIAEMGPVSSERASENVGSEGADADGTSIGAGKTTSHDTESHDSKPKRLYRIMDGAMIGGVCNGVAAYFNVDVTFVRILTVAFALALHGIVVPLYILMWIIVPRADTAEKEAAARGMPYTAQDFVNRARESYSEFAESKRWRKWKTDWKEMRHAERDHWKAMKRAERLQRRHKPFGMVSAILALVWILALLSLITTNALFGWAIPAGIPMWAAIVILFVVYHAVTGPLKGAQYMQYNGKYHYGPWDGLADSLGVLFLVIAILYAYATIPSVHDFILNLPQEIQHAGEVISGWVSN